MWNKAANINCSRKLKSNFLPKTKLDFVFVSVLDLCNSILPADVDSYSSTTSTN